MQNWGMVMHFDYMIFLMIYTQSTSISYIDPLIVIDYYSRTFYIKFVSKYCLNIMFTEETIGTTKPEY